MKIGIILQLQLCVSYKFITEISIYIRYFYCSCCLPPFFRKRGQQQQKQLFITCSRGMRVCCTLTSTQQMCNKTSDWHATKQEALLRLCVWFRSWFSRLSDYQPEWLSIDPVISPIRTHGRSIFIHYAMCLHYKTAHVKSHLIWVNACMYVYMFRV